MILYVSSSILMGLSAFSAHIVRTSIQTLVNAPKLMTTVRHGISAMDSVLHVFQVMVMLRLAEKQSMGSVLSTIVKGIRIRTVRFSWGETNANNASKAFTWMDLCVARLYLLAV
jgi:hypothetical protein